MAWSAENTGVEAVQMRAETALRWPIGVASPLWAVFGAAASAGVAYWWLTRWSQLVNVEALAGLSTPVEVDAVFEAVSERVEAVAAEPIALTAPAPEAAESEVAVAAPEPTVELPADDLTVMTGIGPKLSVALAERGVTRFAQIAAWTDNDLSEVDAALGLKGRAVREAWVAQARRLAAN